MKSSMFIRSRVENGDRDIFTFWIERNCITSSPIKVYTWITHDHYYRQMARQTCNKIYFILPQYHNYNRQTISTLERKKHNRKHRIISHFKSRFIIIKKLSNFYISNGSAFGDMNIINNATTIFRWIWIVNGVHICAWRQWLRTSSFDSGFVRHFVAVWNISLAWITMIAIVQKYHVIGILEWFNIDRFRYQIWSSNGISVFIPFHSRSNARHASCSEERLDCGRFCRSSGMCMSTAPFALASETL